MGCGLKTGSSLLELEAVLIPTFLTARLFEDLFSYVSPNLHPVSCFGFQSTAV